MKISVCMVVRNDKPYLDHAIAAALEYADEVVICDNESSDGTYAYLLSERARLGSVLKIGRVAHQLLLENGYAFVKNLAMESASGDWIHSLDADECLAADQRGSIRGWLERCRRDVVSIRTQTFIEDYLPGKGSKPGDLNLDEPDRNWRDSLLRVTQERKYEETRHRRIFRRNRDIRWRGYIHEELYQGEQNCMPYAENSHFIHWHFTNFRTWQNPILKNRQYGWMLMRAFKNPELQKWTNPWWYRTYVPEHLAVLQEAADRFEEILKEQKNAVQ